MLHSLTNQINEREGREALILTTSLYILMSLDTPFNFASLFHRNSDSDSDTGSDGLKGFTMIYSDISTVIGGSPFVIRESHYSQVNANRVWPGTQILAQYISENILAIQEENDTWLELGAATGALSLFITKQFGKSGSFIGTTTDFDDGAENEIGLSIQHNFDKNDVNRIAHVQHTWGENLDQLCLAGQNFDILFASDILVYTLQYSNLVKTLKALFVHGTKSFIMCWDRPRMRESASFFSLMKEAGFICIKPCKFIWKFSLT